MTDIFEDLDLTGLDPDKAAVFRCAGALIDQILLTNPMTDPEALPRLFKTLDTMLDHIKQARREGPLPGDPPG